MTEDEIRQIKRAAEAQLMALPNVTGVGLGVNLVKGRATGEIAIVVTVRKKVPFSELSSSDVIPPEIQGVPTDVIVVGDTFDLHEPTGPDVPDLSSRRFFWDVNKDLRDRAGRFGQAPLIGGLALMRGSAWAGTLGCIARTTPLPPGGAQRPITHPDLVGRNFTSINKGVSGGFDNRNVPGGVIVGLTNHHVTDGIDNGIGTQGGPFPLNIDTGASGTRISQRLLWQRNTSDLTDPATDRPFVDAAIFELESGIEYYTDLLDAAGPVAQMLGAQQPNPNDPGLPLTATQIALGDYWVCKRGSRSGYSEGIIHSIDLTQHDFCEGVLIRPTLGNSYFSGRGDSGSICLNALNEPIALVARGAVFSGLNQVANVDGSATQANSPANASKWTIACRMDLVVQVMGIEILFDTKRSQKKTV